ncbi:Uncharacterised protein [Mycobacteroides abscessus subsp. abscessus]|nr:Uncharacterised protein [Mycobacteroides abscessus subsp. abscessus]
MQHLGIPGQGGGTDALGLLTHALKHILRRIHHPTLHRIRNSLQHNQIAEALKQIGAEPAWIVPGIHHTLNRTEHRGAVTGGKRIHRVVDQRDIGDTQQRECPLIGDAFLIGPGKQLIEYRQGVTRRAGAGPDHQWVHRVVNGHVLLRAYAFDERTHRLGCQQTERIVVGPRPDGGQHLLRLGGGEDEDQVLGRLLDDLE